MRHRAHLILALCLALASPAFAADDWDSYYLKARDEDIPAKRYEAALRNLEAAVKLKPKPEINARPYGMIFEDYLPYYYQAVCHFHRGDWASAVRLLEIEERHGAIKKRSALYRELLKLRADSEAQLQSAETQRLARRARDESNRLVREASELERTHKYEEALARLAQAQAAAKDLDPDVQRTINEAIARVRGERKQREDAAAATQRIELGLAEGQKLLEQGRDAEAIVQFDQVLGAERGNARAVEGKRLAEERILASQTRQKLAAAFDEGRALFDAGRHQDALLRLTEAAADPANQRARELRDKAKSILEGTRRLKDTRARIDSLLQEGERLLAARKFPEAQVRLEGVLELDPLNARARERLGVAERLTGEALFEKWFPNLAPTLNFYQPDPAGSALLSELEVDSATVSVGGFANDDRGIAKVEFLVGGKSVAVQVPPSPGGVPEPSRNDRFEREFPLEKGLNEISVVVTDTGGLSQTRTFRITRRPRFYETRAFLPAALLSAAGLVGLGLGLQRLRRRQAVRRRFNPYIAGAPILDDSMFFGREKLMARMLNVLHHNSLMITGERRIGKTTFLYHLKRALETDEGTEYQFFPVFTDLQGVPEAGFFQTLMADVIEGLRLAPATLASLRFRGEAERYDGRDFSHDLQRVIDELKTRTDKKVKLALLIDEVDVLNDYSERINQRLRSIFMKTFSEHLVAIMSGVGVKRIWNSEGSPWYNFFDEIELTAFAREEAEALIREPVEGYFRYDAEAAEAILAWSQLKPYVIQKFCIHAVNHMLEERRGVIRLSDVQAVREAVLLDERLPQEPPRAASVPQRQASA
jgi:hypothetical protein